MRLDHEFTVPAPVDRVWQAVLDPERVAPCMPGASLSEVDGDTFRGSVKVKLGPVNLLYKGSGEFQEKDEQERKLVIQASGKDSRGAGTAAATVTVTLTPEGDATKGAVATDLNITGRPAQFGRGMVSDVGGRILDDFAASLARELGSGETRADTAPERGRSEPATETHTASGAGQTGRPKSSRSLSESALSEAAPSETAPSETAPSEAASDGDDSGAVDLMRYAGGSWSEWAVPVLAGLSVAGALIVTVVVVRRKRRR